MSHRDFEREIGDHAEVFDAAAEAMTAVMLAFAHGEISQTQAEGQIREIQRGLDTESRGWVAATVPAVYIDGMNDPETALRVPRTTGTGSLSVPHRTALSLASDAILDDLAAASSNMSRDGRQAIREIAGRNLASSMISGPRLASREVAEEMEERGVRMIDNVGRRWETRGYAEMAMRTKTVDTYNKASLSRGGELGSPGVLVSDGGPGDVDEPCERANGQYWTNDYASTHTLEHPNCRRAFAPLPRDWDGEFDRE